jgi:hypothetical protein
MTLPESGFRNPIRIRKHTDLPTALRPMRQTVSPGMTAKVTSSSPSFDPKEIEAFWSARYGRTLSPLPNMVDCMHRSFASLSFELSRVFFVASLPHPFGHHKLRANGRVGTVFAFLGDES